MSSLLRGIWDNTYGLLVDDGQLAVGAIVALAVTWAIAQTGTAWHDDAGWVLLALVVALLLANLYRAGRNARAKR